MDWQSQLIDVYLTSCDFFSQLSPYIFLKISPNSDQGLSDPEVMTIYIFGIMTGLRTVQSIHSHFKQYMQNWFPKLKEYRGFLFRLNSLEKVFHPFSQYLLEKQSTFVDKKRSRNLSLVDSMPIVMAKGYRAHKSNTAKDIADVGYCSSKKLFYHGLKLHVLAMNQEGTLPYPKIAKITSASVHDLTAMKKDFFDLEQTEILADKAYCDKNTKQKLLKKGVKIHTPIKLSKNKKSLEENEKIYSKIVSSFRQSIEIYFGWLIEKSGIQNASKVRSAKGLIVHVFGRFSACLFKQKFMLHKDIVNT